MIQAVVSHKMAESSEMGFEITLAHVQLIFASTSCFLLPRDGGMSNGHDILMAGAPASASQQE